MLNITQFVNFCKILAQIKKHKNMNVTNNTTFSSSSSDPCGNGDDMIDRQTDNSLIRWLAGFSSYWLRLFLR